MWDGEGKWGKEEEISCLENENVAMLQQKRSLCALQLATAFCNSNIGVSSLFRACT